MTRRPRSLGAVALGLVALLGAACGDDDGDGGGGASTTRTVEVDMRDIAFSPASLLVRKGETVRFVFTNTGALPHDAFVGDEAAQAEHEAEMRAADGEAHDAGHGAEGVTVQPGKTGRLTHTFDEAGTTIVGCHQAGHYDAGMKIEVRVT